jgi:beta-carotene 3-hydroxylase
MSEFALRMVVWLPVALVVAVAMDLWAALLHGRVWHSWLWPVHRSHHTPRPNGVRFEANDALSLLHAPIAVALILHGCRAAPGPLREVEFGVGVGMSLFGVAYLVVHDGLVHGRLPVQWLLRLRYFRGVARAHRVHHTGVAGGAPYGLFLGRWELAHNRSLTRSQPSSEPAPGPSAPRP